MVRQSANFIFATIFSILFQLSLNAENTCINISHISTEDGLIDNRILDLQRDKFGRIWVGTQYGVSMYDGAYFSNFSQSHTNQRHLSSNYAQCILPLDNGDVWIATPDSLNIYDYQKNTIFTEDSKRGLTVNDITSLCRSKKSGNIWLGTYGSGLLLFDSAQDKFKEITFYNENVPEHVMCLTEDNNKFLWIGCRYQGAFRYDILNNRLERILYKDGICVNTILCDRQGTVWIGCDDGLYRHNAGNTQHIDTNVDIDFKVKDICEDLSGRIFVGTDKGLWRYVPQNGHAQSALIKYDDKLLAYNSVSSLFCDDKGMLIIGTYGGGVDFIKETGTSIYLFEPLQVELKYNKAANKSTAILKAEDKLWVGLDGNGLILTDKKSIIKSYDGARIHDENIISLAKDNSGNIWAGGYTKGVAVLNSKKDMFIRPDFEDNYGAVRNITPLSDSTLGLSCGHGFVIYDYCNNKAIFSLKEKTGKNIDVRAIVEHDGLFWCATYGDGLLLVDPLSGVLKSFEKAQGLASTIIYDLAIVNDTLWCATDYGLNYLSLTEQDPDVKCLGYGKTFIALAQSDDKLWTSTYDSIYEILSGSRSLHMEYLPDTANAKDFSERTLTVLDDSILACGGFNGVSIIDSGYTPDHFIGDRIIFTSMLIDNIEVFPNTSSRRGLISNINNQDIIVLEHDRNNLSFRFSLPNYSSEYIRYSYKTSSSDSWMEITGTPSISFNNLQPGEYEITLRASDVDNRVLDTRVLTVKVLPPIWWSTLAKIIYLLICIGLVTLILKLYYVRLKEKTTIEAKLAFFTNVSHELRTPLTLLHAPINKLKSEETNIFKLKNIQMIERNTNRLLNLVNQLLDFKKNHDGHMFLNISRHIFDNYIEDIVEQFKNTYQDKHLNISCDIRLKGEEIYVDSDIIDKILMNILSNAFKFTPEDGTIEFRSSISNGQLLMTCTNTGKGISKSEQERVFDMFFRGKNSAGNSGSGIGLHLVKSLAELHHGSVHIESILNVNTTVSVIIPCEKEAYSLEEISSCCKDVKEIIIEDGYTGSSDKTQVEGSVKTTILIVEDNTEICHMLTESLKMQYNVIAASNGIEAVEIMKNNNIDLVVTDVAMPLMNGIDLCSTIKNDINTNHIPIILLSAKSDMTDIMNGLACGADAYITKPFTLSHLVMQINKLIENRSALREKYQHTININLNEETTRQLSEDNFIDRLSGIILENLSDVSLSGETLSRKVSMSRSSLHRKLKALTNLSTGEFIRNLRLTHAAKELIETDKTISEICYDNGFNTPAYFSTCFTEYFGVSPKQYRQNNRNNS